VDLDDLQRAEILAEAMPIIQAGFHGVDKQETADHLFGSTHAVQSVQRLALPYQNGQLVGFSSYQVIEWQRVEVIYLVGTILDPRVQLRGVCQDMMRRVQGDRRMLILTTQNPRVYHSVTRCGAFQAVYPQISSPAADRDVLGMAEAILNLHERGKSVDPKTMVVANNYPQPLYLDRPRASCPKINAFFTQHVGSRDAVVVIGQA